MAKFADALIGANDPIVLPPGSEAVDWEAELAVVIGSRVSRATEEEAAAAIAGFTVANDISARDFQRRTTEWLQGKTFDATTPLGPFLLTADESGSAPGLEISCTVDGFTKQKADTADLVFSPVELVRYISAVTTLNPGDVILTGTPGGVGDGLTPRNSWLTAASSPLRSPASANAATPASGADFGALTLKDRYVFKDFDCHTWRDRCPGSGYLGRSR